MGKLALGQSESSMKKTEDSRGSTLWWSVSDDVITGNYLSLGTNRMEVRLEKLNDGNTVVEVI